ncbi:MAG: Rnase Y domain-containing protein, partial [Anaerovoracaceae bacterium]
MTDIVLAIIVGIVALLIGILVGYIIRKNLGEKAIGSAETKAKNIILDAENRSETIKKEIALEAKEDALKYKNEAEREIKERRNELSKSENRLLQKEESIDKKLENIERKEQSITAKEENVTKKQKELDELHQQLGTELERISGYTREEAKAILLEQVESEIRVEASQLIRDVEVKAKDEADKKAKEIIVGAIQRCAADHVAESTVSVVNLPNDEMKGRIIGREG